MRRHPSGNYVVEGRKKDLINRGGEKISAEEIENLILTHPVRAERRLRADARSGPGREDVRLRDPATGQAADARRAGGVPARTRRSRNSSCPSGCDVCDDFPVSAFGKVSKKTLRRAGWKTHAHHRPALLSRHRGMDPLPGPVRRGAGEVLEARVGRQDRGRGGQGLHRRRRRGVLVALDLETTIETPPVDQRVRARHVEAPPQAHHPVLGRGRAVRRARSRWRR